MAVLIIVLKTIVAVLSILLSLLILLHKGKGGGIVRHVRRRLDRKRGHIRGRGEEPQPLDGRHRDPMGFADRLDQSHRKNHLTKQEASC